MRSRWWLLLVLLCLGAPALAQTYPSKTVKILVGFPPGGPVDVLARIFADKFTTLWGQPAVVDNRAGATGNIASELAAKAAPDGYTLLFAANTHLTNGALYSKIAYEPIKDFTPISQVSYYSLVLVAHPSLAANTLAELVALAKANPGKLMYNSAGNGTPTHLTTELFRGAAGIDIVHVPYKGGAASTTDLLAGRVQFAFSNPVSAIPHVKSGRLRPLVTTGAARSPFFPEVPTMAESGFPGLEAGTWHLFLGPAGMSRDVVNKLVGDVRTVLRMPDVRERFAAIGVEPIGTTPEQLAVIMRAEVDKWTRVIREAKITLD